MKTKSPTTRRTFDSDRDKAEYYCDKLLYWLYERENSARARSFAERLASLLSSASPGHEAIFPEECWSLICEARGDVPGAIKHRENEVRLMKRLHEISQHSPQRKDVFRLHGYDDLSDHLIMLATLYHESGNLEKAIKALQESESLCKRHGIDFDGQDILHEYVQEQSG